MVKGAEAKKFQRTVDVLFFKEIRWNPPLILWEDDDYWYNSLL